MYIKITVIPNAKKEIVKREDDTFTISVKEPAKQNLANKRVREIIASEYNIPIGGVRLISGHRSPHKIIDVREDYS